MILLLLAAQAAMPAPVSSNGAAEPPATSWSILEKVPDEPCDPRAKPGEGQDVVVCGRPIPSQQLPYPEQVVPDGPQPSNPDLSGTGALAVEDGAPCSSMRGGCTTGIDLFGAGTTLVRLVQKAVSPSSCCERPGEAQSPTLLLRDVVGGVKRAFAKKPDKSKRLAIALDDRPRESVILP